MGLIITGMHRSGTSAIARVVQELGLSSGGHEMTPAPDNPRGFFERIDVMNLNDRWLQSLGGSWWAPPSTTDSTWRNLDQAALDADRLSLDMFNSNNGSWFVKDPRISLLLPLWDRLSLQNIPVVMALRDPREVVTSLNLRNGMPGRQALALWFVHVREALQHSQNRPRLIMDYGKLVESPAHGISVLADFTARCTSINTQYVNMDSLMSLIEPELQRNRANSLQGIESLHLDHAMEMYQLISKANCEVDAYVEIPTLPRWVHSEIESLLEVYESKHAVAKAQIVITELEEELARAAASNETIEVLEARLDQERVERDDLERVRTLGVEQVLGLEAALEVQRTDLEFRIGQVVTERDDQRQQLWSVRKRVQMLGEINEALTNSLAREKTAKYLAQGSANRFEEERLRSLRLMSSLCDSVLAGQNLQDELIGLKASRTFRFSRWFSSSPKQVPQPDQTDSRNHSPQVIPDIEAGVITEIISQGLFDANWYTQQYPDVAQSQLDPFYHFMTQGWREGRNPSPQFNCNWYISEYFTEDQAKVNPLVDFAMNDNIVGRFPLPPCVTRA